MIMCINEHLQVLNNFIKLTVSTDKVLTLITCVQ